MLFFLCLPILALKGFSSSFFSTTFLYVSGSRFLKFRVKDSHLFPRSTLNVIILWSDSEVLVETFQLDIMLAPCLLVIVTFIILYAGKNLLELF